MPQWLYEYFGAVIKPLISRKEGTKLLPPVTFGENQPFSPAMMWIYPSDPVFALSRHNFDITGLFRPRIYLFLPHFFTTVVCLHCGKELEKNGLTPPRRVSDISNNFYVLSWQYYCRGSCKVYFSGWTRALFDTFPNWLKLTFPADLSRRAGLSNDVITTMQVSNQHKMGPSGVRALLTKQHTLRYNRLQLQYLEAAAEVIRGTEATAAQDDSCQETMWAHIQLSIPMLGHFGDPEGYAGFIPSETYLATMLNRSIERDESYANQH